MRALATETLRGCGYTVLEAEQGHDAPCLAAEHAGPIDLLVTDVVMPGMSGCEPAQRLAEERPELRVLYMSGYTDDAILRHGVLEADITLLQKSCSSAGLAGTVRTVLDAPRPALAG